MAGALGTLSMGAGPALKGGIPEGWRGWQNRECPHMLVDDAGGHPSAEPSHVLFLLPGTVSPKHLPCWPLSFRPLPTCCWDSSQACPTAKRGRTA